MKKRIVVALSAFLALVYVVAASGLLSCDTSLDVPDQTITDPVALGVLSSAAAKDVFEMDEIEGPPKGVVIKKIKSVKKLLIYLKDHANPLGSVRESGATELPLMNAKNTTDAFILGKIGDLPVVGIAAGAFTPTKGNDDTDITKPVTLTAAEGGGTGGTYALRGIQLPTTLTKGTGLAADAFDGLANPEAIAVRIPKAVYDELPAATQTALAASVPRVETPSITTPTDPSKPPVVTPPSKKQLSFTGQLPPPPSGPFGDGTSTPQVKVFLFGSSNFRDGGTPGDTGSSTGSGSGSNTSTSRILASGTATYSTSGFTVDLKDGGTLTVGANKEPASYTIGTKVWAGALAAYIVAFVGPKDNVAANVAYTFVGGQSNNTALQFSGETASVDAGKFDLLDGTGSWAGDSTMNKPNPLSGAITFYGDLQELDGAAMNTKLSVFLVAESTTPPAGLLSGAGTISAAASGSATLGAGAPFVVRLFSAGSFEVNASREATSVSPATTSGSPLPADAKYYVVFVVEPPTGGMGGGVAFWISNAGNGTGAVPVDLTTGTVFQFGDTRFVRQGL